MLSCKKTINKIENKQIFILISNLIKKETKKIIFQERKISQRFYCSKNSIDIIF